MTQNDLREMIINNPEAKDRIEWKRITHEVEGNYGPFCDHCKKKRATKKSKWI